MEDLPFCRWGAFKFYGKESVELPIAYAGKDPALSPIQRAEIDLTSVDVIDCCGKQLKHSKKSDFHSKNPTAWENCQRTLGDG